MIMKHKLQVKLLFVSHFFILVANAQSNSEKKNR